MGGDTRRLSKPYNSHTQFRYIYATPMVIADEGFFKLRVHLRRLYIGTVISRIICKSDTSKVFGKSGFYDHTWKGRISFFLRKLGWRPTQWSKAHLKLKHGWRWIHLMMRGRWMCLCWSIQYADGKLRPWALSNATWGRLGWRRLRSVVLLGSPGIITVLLCLTAEELTFIRNQS